MNGNQVKQSRRDSWDSPVAENNNPVGWDDAGKEWETATRPANNKQQRLKVKDAREMRRGAKKPAPQRPALDFSHNPHVSEKFSTRRNGGEKNVPWVSETDHLGRMRLPVLGTRGGTEGIEFVPKNPSVSK